MVMVLLAIRQLAKFEGFDDNEDTAHLKKEVKDDEHILSRNNIFSNLVETEMVKDIEDYKENSKEPFSRKE